MLQQVPFLAELNLHPQHVALWSEKSKHVALWSEKKSKHVAQSFIYFFNWVRSNYLLFEKSRLNWVNSKMLSCFNKANSCIAIHGTNTSEEPSVTANCNGLPVCSIHATENSYIIHITPPGLPLLVSKKKSMYSHIHATENCWSI